MKKSKANLKKLLTPDDLQAIGDVVYGIIDKQVATLATKKDLEEISLEMATKTDISDLKVYINEGFESVMEGVDDIANKLADKEQVQDLEKWAVKTGYKSRLNI